MNYATLAQAYRWVAPLIGNQARATVIDRIDYIRSILYGWFPEIPLAVDRQECVTLEEFPLTCHDCKESYLGFTLPYDAEQVAGVTLNERQIELRTGWEEITQACGCDPVKYDVIQRVHTQHASCPLGCASKYEFYASAREDSGKKVHLRFVDSSGQNRAEELVLAHDQWVSTTGTVAEVKHLVFDEHAGEIVLRQNPEGTILSRYRASETAPMYRRVRVEGDLCCGGRVYVTYIRKRIKVTEDHDLVEVDSPVVWESLAHYSRIQKQLNASIDERREALVHFETAKAFLIGNHRREYGSDMPILKMQTYKPSLNSGLGSKRWGRRVTA